MNIYCITKKIREYLDTVATNDYSLSKIVEKATQAESQFSLLMKTTNIAILGVDKDNFLCSCNEGAEKILNKRSGAVLGNNAEELLPNIPFREVKEKKEEIKNRRRVYKSFSYTYNKSRTLYGSFCNIPRI